MLAGDRKQRNATLHHKTATPSTNYLHVGFALYLLKYNRNRGTCLRNDSLTNRGDGLETPKEREGTCMLLLLLLLLAA